MLSNRKTYTCEKCAKVFKQKSHYTDHQNRKNDCSLSTKLSEMIKEEKSDYITVHVTIPSGNVIDITIMDNSGLNGIYDELSDVLPLSYLNIDKEWFTFCRILSDEDIVNGYRPYDFYNRMRNGERILLTIQRPQYEHLVDKRIFYRGGLFEGLLPQYKEVDKEYATHHGYYFQISKEHSYSNDSNENEKMDKKEEKSPVIVLLQKTSLFPTVAYPPNFVLGDNVDYEKKHAPVNKFLMYACEQPKTPVFAHGCLNLFKNSYDQTVEWKDSIEEAMSTIYYYDARRSKKINQKINLNNDAMSAMKKLYDDYKITSSFVNHIKNFC